MPYFIKHFGVLSEFMRGLVVAVVCPFLLDLGDPRLAWRAYNAGAGFAANFALDSHPVGGDWAAGWVGE